MTEIDPRYAEPVVVRADDTELIGLAPNTIQLLADSPATHGALSVIRSKLGKGMDGATPHHHMLNPEMFFVIEGALQVLTGEQVVTVRAGDFLLIPPHMQHAFGTPADSGVDMLFIMPRAERFDYFRLLDRVRRGEANPQEILATQERFDNYFEESPVWRQFRASAAG